MKSISLTSSLIFVFILTLSGCFAKGKATSSSELNNNVESNEIVSNSDLAMNTSNTNSSMQNQQEPGRYGDTPEDSLACVRNLSLYSEYFRQGNFKLAYGSWQEAMEICPKASVNLYIHGRTILRNHHSNETDPMRRDMLVDSILWLFDKRIDMFGREGFVLGRKAVDIYLLRPEKVQKIFELSTRSIEMEGKDSGADVLTINLQTATSLAQAGIKNPVEIFEIYDRAIKIIDYNIANNPQQANVYQRTRTQIESLFRPYSTCKTLVKAFAPRFEEAPEDIELLEQITSMLDDSDCAEEELFYKATKNLHRLKPTASSAFLMGRLENNQNNYRQAIDYFSQAAELYEEEDDQRYRALMLKSELQFRQLERHSEARASALKAANINPDDGRPYILIGEMYASTAEKCGDDDFTKRTAYWAAVDKFIQARNTDSNPVVVERANQLIDAYSLYFPDGETIFFHGYEEGDSYRIQCWINETTRVRAR